MHLQFVIRRIIVTVLRNHRTSVKQRKREKNINSVREDRMYAEQNAHPDWCNARCFDVADERCHWVMSQNVYLDCRVWYISKPGRDDLQTESKDLISLIIKLFGHAKHSLKHQSFEWAACARHYDCNYVAAYNIHFRLFEIVCLFVAYNQPDLRDLWQAYCARAFVFVQDCLHKTQFTALCRKIIVRSALRHLSRCSLFKSPSFESQAKQ